MPLGLVFEKPNSFGARYSSPDEKFPLEGKEIVEVLMPYSEKLGRRIPWSEAIMCVDPQKSRLAEALLQELPYVQSLNVDDDTKLSMLVSRLDSGSFAESDRNAEILGKLCKEFLPDASPEQIEQASKEIKTENNASEGETVVSE